MKHCRDSECRHPSIVRKEMRRNLGLFLRKASALAFTSVWVVGLIGCGGSGDSKSSKVTLSLVPAQPLVINATVTTGSGTNLTAPWFQFSVQVTNNSGTPLTLVALQLIVNGFVKGAVVQNKQAFSPSLYNYSTLSGQNCVYNFFDTINSTGQPVDLSVSSSTSGCQSFSPAVFYSMGNPLDPDLLNPTFNYSATLTPAGWFGDQTNPKDRFTGSLYFSTR